MTLEVIDSGGARDRSEELDDHYKTTDLETAAILRTIGHKFIGLEKKRSRRSKKLQFVFATKSIKSDMMKMVNDELAVNPRLLLNNFNDLKNMIHNKEFT
jgi:hypothetical protein